MCETGSVSVWPTVSGASVYVLVLGVVSTSLVFVGDQIGTPVSVESRIMTPVTAADVGPNVSKYGPDRRPDVDEERGRRRPVVRTMRRTLAATRPARSGAG